MGGCYLVLAFQGTISMSEQDFLESRNIAILAHVSQHQSRDEDLAGVYQGFRSQTTGKGGTCSPECCASRMDTLWR